MNEKAPIVVAEEWARVQALIDLAEAKRRLPPEPTPQQALDALEKSEAARQGRRTALQTAFADPVELTAADQDILIFSLAPMASPRIGWHYRVLQSGDVTGQPGIDLICELLDLKPADAIHYRNRLAQGAPLIRHGLVAWDQSLPYRPIRPTHRAMSRVLGVQSSGMEVPGATLVQGGPILDDVICPTELKTRLEQLAQWPEYDRTLSRWRMAVDHGPVALFSGPSGTGKTMAAEAIAHASDRALYRVDLGMLVSKYIGETEKNLNAMFDAAREIDCILLFDEADSLFGKRGEVKDAKDRYANMEVGHLLSRIERHLGMCILTTNLKDYIDPAFLRRIDVVIPFALPTAADRKVLWQRYLGTRFTDKLSTNNNKSQQKQDAPAKPIKAEKSHSDIQNTEEKKDRLASLADIPRLSGAQIANACRYAARRLAPDYRKRRASDETFYLTCIAEGVHNELRKSGGEVMKSSLGFLFAYIEGAL
ncbi:MAG: ATP-binding protein [Desulfatitalea sp.]|nr:ATP-binding protein [Desulfatitalea sp.]NNK02470.1 ATP-binding protein [Desulfatitalea sp.]